MVTYVRWVLNVPHLVSNMYATISEYDEDQSARLGSYTPQWICCIFITQIFMWFIALQYRTIYQSTYHLAENTTCITKGKHFNLSDSTGFFVYTEASYFEWRWKGSLFAVGKEKITRPCHSCRHFVCVLYVTHHAASRNGEWN